MKNNTPPTSEIEQWINEETRRLDPDNEPVLMFVRGQTRIAFEKKDISLLPTTNDICGIVGKEQKTVYRRLMVYCDRGLVGYKKDIAGNRNHWYAIL